jgi:hypothetical protein
VKQSAATELLDQRLKDVWAPANPTVPYALNNEMFRPATRPFAVFIVAGVTSEQRSQGPEGKRRFEYRGMFVAQLFGEIDAGTQQLDLLVDGVRSVFSAKHLSTVGDPLWTKGAAVSNPVQRDGLHMLTVQIPFTFYNLE